MHTSRLVALFVFVSLFALSCSNSQTQGNDDQAKRAATPSADVEQTEPAEVPAVVDAGLPAPTPDAQAQVDPSRNVVPEAGQNLEKPAVAETDVPPSGEEVQAEPVPAQADPEPVAANDVANDSIIRDDTSPLPEAVRQKLANITWDLPPEVLNAVEKENEGGHFPFSDELHPEKFRDTIAGMGGTYIGIGTDQSYVYMGWQKPTLAFVVDYDPWVVYIHHAYLAFFDHCEDSACLMAMFDDRNGSSEFLETYYANSAEKKNIIKVFKTVSGNIRRQLGRLSVMKVPNFVNNPETYQYIRTLVQAGRVVTLQANLLGDTALKGIAQTLRDTGRTVTTFYTSNAEQYWGYKKAFKENMRAMPFAENALIMRTSATKPINSDYRYSVQPARVFLAWLDDPRGTAVKRVTKSVRPKDENDFPFVYDDAMPEGNE